MAETHIVPQVTIDGSQYYYERGSYFHIREKDSEEGYAVTKTLHHVEGGLNPQQWRMNIVCTDRDSLDALETSYQKVTYANRVLAFTDRFGDSHSVYFSNLGPVQNLDLKVSLFRVPILLTEEVTV